MSLGGMSHGSSAGFEGIISHNNTNPITPITPTYFWCLVHGTYSCWCLSGCTNGTTISVNTWTCAQCGLVCLMGTYHFCTTTAPGTVRWVNPAGNQTISFPLPECAFCDKLLESDDKKVCKECRGVFEAWKFLSKRDESEPDKEPEG